MAFTGAIPINQLNSLPLFSISQLAFGGTVSVLGGAINRYFAPVDTGINGAVGNMSTADPDPSTAGAIRAYSTFSNLLDVRGCTRFTVLIAVKMPAADEDVVYDMDLRIQSPVAADIPSVVPRSGNYGAGAWPKVASFAFPVTVAGGAAGYKSSGQGWQVGGPLSATLQTGSLGYIYLWLNLSNAGSHKDAVMFVSMYATS
jgi:hypothetical protein